jgi:hypothetical protein
LYHIQHHHHHHWQNNPFWAIAFLRWFCQYHPVFTSLVYCNTNSCVFSSFIIDLYSCQGTTSFFKPFMEKMPSSCHRTLRFYILTNFYCVISCDVIELQLK